MPSWRGQGHCLVAAYKLFVNSEYELVSVTAGNDGNTVAKRSSDTLIQSGLHISIYNLFKSSVILYERYTFFTIITITPS